jgi:hypothetical protein
MQSQLLSLCAVFGVFLISLQSYYIQSLSVSIFPLLGSVILFVVGLVRSRLVDIALPLLFLLVFYFLYYVFVDAARHERFGTILALPFLAFAVVGGSCYFRGNLVLGSRVLGLVICIHLLLYFVQVLYWVSTGLYLDFLEPITGEMQKYSSAKGAMFNGVRVPRFTGVFNEPGTYSTYLFALMILKYLIDREMGIVVFLTLLTISMNLSLFGAVLSFCFILVVIFEKRSIRVAVGAGLFCIAASFFMIPAIVLRLTGGYAEVSERGDLIGNLWDPERLLFGVPGSGSEGYFALNDAGMWVASLLHGGVFEAFLLVLVLLLVVPLRVSSVVLVLLVTLTKIKMTYPFLWFFLTVLMLIRKGGRVPEAAGSDG